MERATDRASRAAADPGGLAVGSGAVAAGARGGSAGGPDAAPGSVDPPPPPRPTARQRWRLVYRRLADAPPLDQRATIGLWESALASTGLPLLPAGDIGGRPKLAFGAPLSIGMAAEAELIDLFLTELAPAWRVRTAIDGVLPAGHELVDLYDVWLGAPALAGRVAAADYRIELRPGGARGGPEPRSEPAPDDVRAAAAALLRARSLRRTRPKGSGSVEYDLRPLVAGLELVEGGPPLVVRVRTVFHPERGTGRPEEVVAALAGELGADLAIDSIVRERLLLDEDVPGLR